MKNKLLQSAAIIVLIFVNIFLVGCGGNSSNSKENKAQSLKDLSKLSDKLIKTTDASSINSILKEYYELNSTNVTNVYFGQTNGFFYSYPNVEAFLPAGFDPRKREWYMKAIENGNFSSEPIQDISNGNTLVNYAKAISKDNISIGVVAIDRLIRKGEK